MNAGTQLDGRVAVITGAGSGLGRRSALRFAEEGARWWWRLPGGRPDPEGQAWWRHSEHVVRSGAGGAHEQRRLRHDEGSDHNVALFLVSDAAAWVSGVCMPVDGATSGKAALDMSRKLNSYSAAAGNPAS